MRRNVGRGKAACECSGSRANSVRERDAVHGTGLFVAGRVRLEYAGAGGRKAIM